MHRIRTIARASAGLLALATTAALTSGFAVAPSGSEADTDNRTTQQQYDETTLWDSTIGPRVNYHVQGLTVMPDDTILAFAEGRYQTCDAGPREIDLRRSVDAGATFSGSQVVVPTDGERSFGNPTALVDAQTNTVFLFYNESFRLPENTTCSGDSGRVFYRTSQDEGVTWSEPTEITNLFASNPYGWTLHGPGPGHGIQLKDGRLVVQMAHRKPIVGTTAATRDYGVNDVYSDDHGATWHSSAPIPVSRTYPINESRIVQRSDGSLVVNGRYAAGGTHYRISAVSTDRGETWSDPVYDTATGQYVAIDSGFIMYSDGASPQTQRLIFSRTDARNRTNMTVSVSYDGGYSYAHSRVANPGTSYYSDLATLSDGTIVMLYGKDGTSASVPQKIVLARFNMSWLTDGADAGAGPVPIREVTTELGTRTALPSTLPWPTVVADANARGGKLLDFAAMSAGDHVDIPFLVTRSGTYDATLRYKRGADTAAVQASIDGSDAGEGFDPSLSTGAAFQNYDLGALHLRAGRHTLRLTVTAQGASGGWHVSPDELVLSQPR
jgi:hypothetical protein